MRDPSRLTVDEFFAWQEHAEGRYELVDGHIVPHPDYVTLEVLSPSTARIDRGRKVAEYLAIASLEAYVALDAERRSITVYRRDEGPQTFVGPLATDAASAAVALSPTLALPFEVFS